MACVVVGCNSHSTRFKNTNEFITFHRFPKDEARKKLWLQNLSRYNWTPKIHSHICSKHFTKDSFVPSENVNYRRLKVTAIPILCLPEKIDYPGPSGTVFHLQESHLDDKKPLSDLKEYVLASERTKRTGLAGANTNNGLKLSYLLNKQNEAEIEITKLKNKIGMLEKELQVVKMVSKRRLRKINTLTKRNSRISKKNYELYTVLMEKSKR